MMFLGSVAVAPPTFMRVWLGCQHTPTCSGGQSLTLLALNGPLRPPSSPTLATMDGVIAMHGCILERLHMLATTPCHCVIVTNRTAMTTKYHLTSYATRLCTLRRCLLIRFNIYICGSRDCFKMLQLRGSYVATYIFLPLCLVENNQKVIAFTINYNQRNL
jgi:hypothetical protein